MHPRRRSRAEFGLVSFTPCCCSDLFHFTTLSLFIPHCSALFPFTFLSLHIQCCCSVFLSPFTCPSLLIPCCCSVFLFHFNLIYLFLFLSPAADPLSSPFSSYPMLLICLLVWFNLSLCIHCCCSIVLFPFNLISLIPCYCSVKLFPFNLLSSLLTSAVLSSRRHFIFCFFVSFAAAMMSYSPLISFLFLSTATIVSPCFSLTFLPLYIPSCCSVLFLFNFFFFSPAAALSYSLLLLS